MEGSDEDGFSTAPEEDIMRVSGVVFSKRRSFLGFCNSEDICVDSSFGGVTEVPLRFGSEMGRSWTAPGITG